jgi:hypothetical protein
MICCNLRQANFQEVGLAQIMANRARVKGLRQLAHSLDASQGSSQLHGQGPWLVCQVALRAASHYGQRSRGCQFPPIVLQETKSSASRQTLHI